MPMDTLRIIFHLGMPKTGTSLLQNCLYRSLSDPGASHVILPRLGRGAGIAHHELVQRLRDLQPGGTAQLADELMAEIHASRAGGMADSGKRCVAFVTSEQFTSMCGADGADHLADFIALFGDKMDAQAVIVIRELSEFLESMYLQSARAGNLKWTFDDYVSSRQRWASRFFRGIAKLKGRLGDKLRIEFQHRGFDVLRVASTLLEIPEEVLQRASRTLPSTAKRELKEQVALSFLAKSEQAVGFPIDRSRLVRLFDATPDLFENRIKQYTLYTPETRREAVTRFLQIADEARFPEYRAAFEGALRGREIPTHALDFSCLDGSDFARLSAHRNVIEGR
jgi:hypothetical protein